MTLIFKRILYRATYRGSQEADIILKKFVNHTFNLLSPQEIIDLDCLLQQDDDKIFDWIENTGSIPEKHNTSVLHLLRLFIKSLKK